MSPSGRCATDSTALNGTRLRIHLLSSSRIISPCALNATRRTRLRASPLLIDSTALNAKSLWSRPSGFVYERPPLVLLSSTPLATAQRVLPVASSSSTEKNLIGYEPFRSLASVRLLHVLPPSVEPQSRPRGRPVPSPPG